MLKQRQLQLVFTLIIFAVVLLMYNHNKTLALEKEHARINKELHLIQVTFERRQKAYDEKMKQRRIEIERMRKAIN